MAPQVPIMFISPNNGPTCWPDCSIAADHQDGSAICVKKSDTAAKAVSTPTDSARTAQNSAAPLAKNIDEQKRRRRSTGEPAERTIRSAIEPPTKTPSADPHNANDASFPVSILSSPCADSK